MTMMLRQHKEQEGLLYGAICYGSYLWSNRDVENALLWFQQPPLTSSDVATAVADEPSDEKRGCEFLRRLLHAPGASICMPRPNKVQSIKRHKKSTSSGGAKSHDHDGRSCKIRGGKPTSASKKEDEFDREGTKLNEAQAPPLRSVLLGYYQLFLAPSNDNDGIHPNDDKKEKGEREVDIGIHKCQFTDADIQNAELASSRLLADLSSIITARKQTNDIYQAFMNVASQENVFDSVSNATATGRSQERIRMSCAIDEYMTRPTTCTQRVYASSIFDWLLNHCRRRGNENTTRLESENDDNPELHRFLTNLFRLASTNTKIQEVVMLVLIEPVRRLGCAREQPCSCSSVQTCPVEIQISKDADSTRHQLLPGTEFPPIPLCTSLWNSVSSETIEEACTRYPLPLILQSILSTARRSAAHPSLGDTSLGNTSLLAAPEEFAHDDAMDLSQAILWWTLPSPLLCTISQLYFPVACKYIQYWIWTALMKHEELYEHSYTGGQEKGTNAKNENFDDLEEPFFHALRRIQQFRSTSDRLNSLCTQALQSMKKESSSLTMSLFSDDDENSAFRASLAWKAIHLALEK